MPAMGHRPLAGRVVVTLSAAFLGAVALVWAPVAQAQIGPPPGAPSSFADLVDHQLSTVVNISTSQSPGAAESPPEMPELPPGSPFEEFFREFWDRQGSSTPEPVTSLGSGFIIDPEGIVVTNNHVVEGADTIKVILHDESALDAEVIGADPLTDLAILRVRTESPLPSIRWGDSDALRVGDWVVAIGNPFGLGGSVTAGILSARARDIEQRPYDEYLQTDASINRGNSGGPLFNTQGEVVGINTAIFSPTGGSVGIGFAIPVSLARPVIDEILRYGSPRRGWLGVQIQPVTEDIAESLGLDEPKGALVTTLTPGGPAEQAGIRQGDVIVQFGESPIEDMRDLPRVVADAEIGDRTEVQLLREGRRETIEVTVGDMDEAQQLASLDAEAVEPPAEQEETLGLTLSPLNDAIRETYDIPMEVEGVAITEMDDGSAVAEADIQPGDVIVEVGQEAVTSPEDVVRQIAEAREAGRNNILMLLNRQGDMRFVPVPIEDDDG